MYIIDRFKGELIYKVKTRAKLRKVETKLV